MARRLGLLAVLAGCTGPKQPEVAIDAALDAATTMRFTGEYIDWDSTPSAFCGIYMAKLQVHGGTAAATTPPNGRIALDVPTAGYGSDPDYVRVDITPPTIPSECTSPTSSYSFPGIAIARYDVINTGRPFSARAITDAREQPFLQQFAMTLDPTKAHVLVHVDGPPGPVGLSPSAVADSVVFDGTQWSTGNTGQDVFFPNVPTSTGQVGVVMPLGAHNHFGEGEYPVEPGKITYVMLAVF